MTRQGSGRYVRVRCVGGTCGLQVGREALVAEWHPLTLSMVFEVF